MGTCAGAQAVGHGNSAGHAGAEADTVVGAGNVIVHRLRNGDDLHAFLIEPHTVAQRVVSSDGDEVIDAQPVQILEHFRGQVVFFGVVSGLQMRRHAGLTDPAGIRTGRMQERAASPSGAVDQILR